MLSPSGLQSEKVIRTRSLTNQGFNMAEVKEIFSSVSSSANTESDVDLLSECLNFQLENIQFHIEIQREDQPIIYYVAGAISRAILKQTKCEKCLELLSAGNLEVGTTNFENIEARQEFISKLSRGGLLKPPGPGCSKVV